MTPKTPDSQSPLTSLHQFLKHLRQRWRESTTSPLNSAELKIIEDLFTNGKALAIALSVCFGVGIYTLWNHIPKLYIIAFIVVFVIEAIVKINIGKRFTQASDTHKKAPIWRVILVCGALWSGLLYGLVALTIFLPLSAEERLLLVGVFVGIWQVFSLISSFSEWLTGWLIIPILAPTTIGLLVVGTTTTNLMAVMLITSTVCTLYLGRLSAERFRNLSNLFEQNQHLMTVISREQKFAEQERQRAELAVVKNSRFMAAASHDLRQPLHAIGLFQHALKHLDNPTNKDFLFNSIERSMTELNTMFDSLMDVSQLDSNVVAPDFMTIRTDILLVPLIEETRSAATEKNLDFDINSSNATIETDPILLGRIIRNLLSNAVKFTESGKIGLSTHHTDEALTIKISDTGIGIPESEQLNIFEEFYQITPDAGRQHGVGLGLSIVSRLCQMLNINLSVKSNHPTGTIFSLRIALAATTAATETPTPHPTDPDLQGMTIVFIDDEFDIRSAMKQTLKLWGCESHIFASPEDAIDTIQKNTIRPDLLICDYQLNSTLNGLDTIRVLRGKIDYHLPSILITGEKSTELNRLSRQENIPLLTKPISPDELKQITGKYYLAREAEITEA